jgi:RecA-family ATPase
MSFGKRATLDHDNRLAKAVSDATDVGVSRHDIREITDSLSEDSRTVGEIEDAIAKIERLTAAFVANHLDSGNLVNQPMEDASLVPDQSALVNTESKSADNPNKPSAYTDESKTPGSIQTYASVNISTPNVQSYDHDEFSTYGRHPASEALVNTRLNDVAQTERLLRAIPFSEMLTHRVKPIDELIPGFIEKGVATMLSGLGGTHKSRLALQLGLCIQAGLEVFGKKTAQATFIYLDYENGKSEVARRTKKMNWRLSLPFLTDGHYLDFKTPQSSRVCPVALDEIAPPLATVTDDVRLQPFYHELWKYLRGIPGHKFVVADSAYDVLRFVDHAKINETKVRAALTVLDYLCAATDTTMLYLWRCPPSRTKRSDPSPWSWMWESSARARLSINKLDETKDAFVLRVERRNNGPGGEGVTLRWSDGILLPSTEPGDNKNDNLLYEASVQPACIAAEMDSTVQYQKDFAEGQLDEIERNADVHPSEPEAKYQHENAINTADTSAEQTNSEYLQAETNTDAIQEKVKGVPAEHGTD